MAKPDLTKEALGFVPGVGTAMDVADVAKSVATGDYVGAAVNTAATVLGIVPGVGRVAGKGLKAVAKTFRQADIEDAKKLSFKDSSNLAYVTQTTLSVDDTKEIKDYLLRRFPNIKGPKKDDICYATQNRQDAIKQLALESDLVIVIGSENSSNSNRLREIAERSGVEAYLIDSIDDLSLDCLEGKSKIGLTSGASAPEHLVSEVIEKLSSVYGFNLVGDKNRTDEGISFRLPKGLR